MAETGKLMGLRRGIAVLRCMADTAGGITFGALQKKLDDVPAPTLSRLLTVMTEDDLVDKDPRTGAYRTGEAFYSLCRLTLNQLSDGEIVQPILDVLANETGCSAAFARLEHDGFSYQAKTEVDESFHYMPANRLNANTISNGFGLLCLAYAPEKVIENFIAFRRNLLGAGGEAGYLGSLSQVKTDGYFMDRTKVNMTRFVAAVFRGSKGEPAGAVGVTALGDVTDPAEQQRLMDAVKKAASKATDMLA